MYPTYLLTYLLTPLSRVLFEKLTGSAASQEIPRIFGTRRFITVLTSARHLSLSWANSIQSSQPPPTSWRSILILSSHLNIILPSPVVSFPQVSPPEPCAPLSPAPYAPHTPLISLCILRTHIIKENFRIVIGKFHFGPTYHTTNMGKWCWERTMWVRL